MTGGLGWMYGRDLPLLSLTFARQINARELLERMGVDRDTVAVRERDDFHYELGGFLYASDGYVVSAGHYRSWAWAWEHGSWKGMEDRGLVLRASIGTAALVLNANEKPGVVFRYAENGRLVTGFDTMTRSLADGTGSDPHRFDTEMRALGARPEEDEDGPLGPRGLFYRLAENLGVGLPLDALNDRPVLSARLLPPPSRL
ncbi:DUF6461 domain-containing protein [Nocardia sp. CDC160]|uniref:DUF6461 domain-containing protein n=1 Tax=Nocardia sp. CDC160 TaxID=3112166 RepID=UPI002DBD43FA|nr:DUF6461 domain-containing protein [Nocardia sp. CDC160]MEC3918528.1 DUF6461 domain-containing protein [Nocardia sp. CDC160]